MDIWESFHDLLEALRNFKLALRDSKLDCSPGDFPGLEDLGEYAPYEAPERRPGTLWDREDLGEYAPYKGKKPAKTTKPLCAPTLWDRLVSEGRHDLITKLRHAEIRESGFGTIVVPRKGFSDNDDTHNMVLAWLREHKINILNPGLEVTRLERALHGNTNQNVSEE